MSVSSATSRERLEFKDLDATRAWRAAGKMRLYNNLLERARLQPGRKSRQKCGLEPQGPPFSAVNSVLKPLIGKQNAQIAKVVPSGSGGDGVAQEIEE